MAAYIKGAAVLSPQNTFGESGFPDEIHGYTEAGYFKCIEPQYRDFIDPMVSRRMSRIVKMGVSGALKCIKNTGIQMPDAIITGTGMGCLEDTEKFLASIYKDNEKLLNPTPFIQSTHNTVAGAIALAIKCHNYNITYTHRGFSFESAVEDTLLQLAENPSLNILTGGFDEITDNLYSITKRLGLWRKGGIPGEGVAFFMMSGEKGEDDMSILQAVSSFYKPEGLPAVKNQIHRFLKDADKTMENIDLVILGINGDFRSDKIYYQLMDSTFRNMPCIDFKHLCGEYDTASSFALWLASLILKQQNIPAQLLQGNKVPAAMNNILIYNHLRGINHSLYLLEQF